MSLQDLVLLGVVGKFVKFALRVMDVSFTRLRLPFASSRYSSAMDMRLPLSRVVRITWQRGHERAEVRRM